MIEVDYPHIYIYLFNLNNCFFVSVISFDRLLTSFIDTIKTVGYHFFDFQITEKKFARPFSEHISNMPHDTSFFRMYISRSRRNNIKTQLFTN